MTVREQVLATALGIVAALLLGLWVWQGGRYADAQAVMREYSRLEAQIQRLEEEDPERAAAMKVARTEVRRRLARGELTEALRRIAAIRAEDEVDPEPEAGGPPVAIDSLWPPGSKERERARQVLAEVSRKQAQGFDITAARDELVEVAAAARRGDRRQALELFAGIPPLLQSAPLRPGFRSAPAAPGPAGAVPEAGAALPPVTDQQIAQLEQAMQLIPRMAEQVGPERRRTLLRVPPLVARVTAAHRRGKDIRPLLPLVMGLRGAFQDKETRRAEQLLQQIRQELPRLKPLPPGAAPAVPASPTTPATTPPAVPGSVPPGRRAVPPLGMPSPGAGEVLRTLDALRRMPEPEYQQRRLVMAEMIARALRGGVRPPAPAPGGNRIPRPLTLGGGDPFQLLLDRQGAILEWRLRGEPEHRAPGGLVLRRGEQVRPLRGGTVSRAGAALVHRLSAASGGITATYHASDGSLRIDLQAEGAGTGPAAVLELRLPLAAQGWRWSAAGEERTIQPGQRYSAAGPDAAAALWNADLRLEVAGTAAELEYDPERKQLVARYPIESGAAALAGRLEIRVIETK